jgi:UDP:flavonoid glycosyltransferase YjiC (YdhE family)
MRKPIVIATWGSLGDLHPFIAIALGLRERGHEVVMATCECFRQTIEQEALRFHPLPPDLQSLLADQKLLERLLKSRHGFDLLQKKVLLPGLRESFESLYEACRGAGLLFSSDSVIAASPAAEKSSIPWLTSVLQPRALGRCAEEHFVSDRPGMRSFRIIQRKAIKAFKQARRSLQPDPVERMRSAIGLAPMPNQDERHGRSSPVVTLALFSQALAGPDDSWPPGMHQTGFPFYLDRADAMSLSPGLDEFLRHGDAPVVFTLGSTAVRAAGDFFETSVAAIQGLACRAVLLVGKKADAENLRSHASDSVFVADYAPFPLLFPRAAVIVHQGGIGTLACCLWAGRPMLIVPYAFDQPDNACRAVKLGVARTVARAKYKVPLVASELSVLLKSAEYLRAAQSLAKQIRREDGVREACGVIERYLET